MKQTKPEHMELRSLSCAAKARREVDDRTEVPAVQEMRVGPSGSDGRVWAQTAGSCSGPMAGVVSVSGKGGTKPVRCALGRRTRVNRRQRVESEWTPSKPGSDKWSGTSPGDGLLAARVVAGTEAA